MQFGQHHMFTSERLGRLAFTIRIRIAAGVSRLRLAARRGFILRRALGLNGLSHKSSIRLNFPFDQALRAILEGVRERIGTYVADGKGLSLLDQDEIHAAGIMLNRAVL